MAFWNAVMSSTIAIEGRFDGEYYSPFYSNMDEALSKVSCVDNLGRLVHSMRKGIFDISPKLYRNKGIPLVRTLQIKSPLLSKESLVYIDAKDHKEHFNKTELTSGDIVFTKIGAGIGDVAVLPTDYKIYNFSQNVAGVSINREKIDGFYLLAYLATKWGRNQLLRYMMPSGQGKLELRDIKKIKVVRLGNSEAEIANLISCAEKSVRESQEKYLSAVSLLQSELGLDKLTFQKPVSYLTYFSEIEIFRRTDPEFFHVRYEPFLSSARGYTLGWNTLGAMTSRTLPNFDARKHSINFEYIEIGDINVGNGSYKTTTIYSKDLPANAKIELSGGEILLSQVRPARGAIAITKDIFDHPTICSGAFYVCTANDVNHREIIWLYLRTVKDVFEKYCGGTSYPTIDSRYIAKFPVPLFSSDLAVRIQDLVLASKQAQQKSDELLEQAKTRVEQLIEAAVQP